MLTLRPVNSPGQGGSCAPMHIQSPDNRYAPLHECGLLCKGAQADTTSLCVPAAPGQLRVVYTG